MSAIVAIVGKPNVGKSTLFNRIFRKRLAIESKTPGTTRDRIFANYEGDKLDITFVDTGGIMLDKDVDNIDEEVQKQSNMALDEADLILFCVDTKTLPTEIDYEIVRNLQKRNKEKNLPVFFVGTKADSGLDDTEKANFYDFGFDADEMFFVSSFHNAGVDSLLSKIEKELVKRGYTKSEKENEEEKVSISILGRPNAGKSSLVNAYLNENKLIVSDIPGTTRDSINVEINYQKKKFEIIDTAGIRRRKNREKGIEEFSVIRSIKSLQKADVAVLLLDANDKVTHQDQVILEQILEANTGLIIAVNKWDEKNDGRFVNKEKGDDEMKINARKKYLRHLQQRLPFASWAPVIFISAVEKKNIAQLLDVAEKIKKERAKEIPTPVLNQFLQEIFMKNPLRGRGNIVPKVKFGRQKDINPPHFLFFANDPDCIHFSSRRFMENRIRSTFGFEGTSIILEFRQK